MSKSLSKLNRIAFPSSKVLRNGSEERGVQGESFNFIARNSNSCKADLVSGGA